MFSRIRFVAALLMVIAAACAPVDPNAVSELQPLGVDWRPGPAEYGGHARDSSYLTMRDGVRIAVDVYLPKGLAEGVKAPAILRATRYWRRWDLRAPFSWFMGGHPLTEMFTRRGYAVVHVDARGSGASFGSRPYPWSEAEIKDYDEIIDWIGEQPWSNGRVGAQGISYDGTAAEFVALLDNPALEAACIRFSLYDVYADIAFPGGVMNDRFLRSWSRFNRDLDLGGLPGKAPLVARVIVDGPAPVDVPNGRELLEKALAEHLDNVDIHKAARQVEYRDETAREAGVAVNAFSPHAREGNGVPLLVFGGWSDGFYADAALKRFMLHGAPQRVIIGAWNHAGTEDADPWKKRDADAEPGFDAQLLEILRFFDYHLKDEGERPREEIVFKIMGAERWLRSEKWPPAGVTSTRMALTPDAGLSLEAPRERGEVEFVPNMQFKTGGRRWRTQLTRGDVYYEPWVWEQNGTIVFKSVPMWEDIIIAGSPAPDLKMTSSLPGAALHAYLLAVGPDGERVCLTEGMFRLKHRAVVDDAPPQALGAPVHSYRRSDAEPLGPGVPGRVAFGMASTAIRVPAGYRLALVLAGRDASQFAGYPGRGNPVYKFFTGEDGSFLEIPVLEAAPEN